MPRKKLKKIKEVAEFPNVFDFAENASEDDLRKYFNNNNKITLEIGCGEGDYTVKLAELYPKRNFIGIDFKGARIHTGARKALEENIDNAGFLWMKADDLPELFKNEKIEEIFITFPEPHVKRRLERKRLVSPRFLEIYKKIIQPGARIHLKTDDNFLYEYALKVLEERNCNIIFSSFDLHEIENLDDEKRITTRYERYYLREGRKIKYIEFQIN